MAQKVYDDKQMCQNGKWMYFSLDPHVLWQSGYNQNNHHESNNEYDQLISLIFDQ